MAISPTLVDSASASSSHVHGICAGMIVGGEVTATGGSLRTTVTQAFVASEASAADSYGSRPWIGSTIELDDFASRSGTIGYQVLTSLGPRYRRDTVGAV